MKTVTTIDSSLAAGAFSVTAAMNSVTAIDFSPTAAVLSVRAIVFPVWGNAFPVWGKSFSFRISSFPFSPKTFSPFGENRQAGTLATTRKVLKPRDPHRCGEWRIVCFICHVIRTEEGGDEIDQTKQKREDRKVRHAEVRERAPEYDGDGDSENDQNQEVTISLSEGESI